MRRFRGRRVVRRRGTVWSRGVPSGIWGRPRKNMNLHEGDEQARKTAEAVVRRSYGKLVAFLAARTNDVASAEDALSAAFAAALAAWPRDGCPANAQAGLMAVAAGRVICVVR